MGNLFFQPEEDDPYVLGLELKYNIPIVGVVTRPIVKFDVDAPCQFKWTKGDEKILVGQSISYTPVENDAGSILEFTCILFCNRDGISKTIKTQPVVGFPELHITRRITSIPRQTINLGKIDYMGTSLFRIVSYNLMAQSRIKEDVYDCPSWALQWVYRKRVLFSEIKLLDSDVFCLQEVPTKEVSEFWDIELSKLGFSSFVPDKNTKPGKMENTLGIFFRRVKFGLLKQWTIDYDAVIPKLHKDIVCDSEQFAIIVLLEFKDFIKDAPNRIIIANTLTNSKMSMYQVEVLQRALSEMVEKESPLNWKIPVVIGGSFGVDCDSQAYQSLNQCDLGIESMYCKGLGKEPSYNVGNNRVKTEDFIFASRDFVLTQVMDFDDAKYPNKNSCSDHLPLYCELDVKK